MPVSIGIPFYNAESWLPDAIRSVFAQTYEDWELILVDDGSTDGSLEIAHSVDDQRIRVISDGLNKKLPSRLNQIAYLAKYDFVGRMDADDLISPCRFEKQMRILEEIPNIDLVSSGVFSLTNDLKLIGARWHDSTSISLSELLVKKGCGVVHAAILGRKEWFLRNPYDTTLNIAQDYDLWLKSSANNDFNIYLIQEPLYFYREEGNATTKKILAAYKNERRMYLKYGGSSKSFLVFKSFLKTGVVKMLSYVNQIDLLLKRRSSQLKNDDLLKLFETEMDQIMRTRVPGLD